MTAPTFAYALNNPIEFIDSDGLKIRPAASPELSRQVARFRSTPSGRMLWNLLAGRDEIVSLEDYGPIRWNTPRGNIFEAGGTSPTPDGARCATITHKSLERAWWTVNGRRLPMDPAAIMGHELVHAWMRIYEPGRRDTEWLEEEFQLRIQQELEEIEGSGP
jgi:hypothetical protein